MQPVCISYQFKGSDKFVTKELFKVGSSFPSTKSITFDNKSGGANLLVHYGPSAELMKGLPNQIAQYEISEGKQEEKTEKFSFTMRVSNNIHNVCCLDEAEYVQEWTEEEKIPVKGANPTPPPAKETKKEDKKDGSAKKDKEETVEEPPKPAPQSEQKYEIKKRQKKNFIKLEFQTSNHALAPNVRNQFFEVENGLTGGDVNILEVKELRNNLEAYSYDMRNNLDSYGTFEKYLDDETKKPFLAEINEVVEWIYGDGETAPKEEYIKKLAKFKAIGDPVKARHFYYSELELYLS